MKRKKNSRQRGSHTHGGGAKKKRRGAGNRGGRGRAGSGKRGDAKKPSYQTPGYMGKHGFKTGRSEIKAINIATIEKRIDSLSPKIEKDIYNIDLTSLGYDKLLSGKPTRKYNIKVDYASKGAIEKIKAAGGSVKTASE
ncbi:MAG: uL15m family ribosomal protein [archaeon]